MENKKNDGVWDFVIWADSHGWELVSLQYDGDRMFVQLKEKPAEEKQECAEAANENN